MTDTSTVPRSVLGSLDRIGKGGTAVVHRLTGFSLPGLPPLVFKEYKASTREQAGPALGHGLISLVQHRLRKTETERREWDGFVNWPLRVVVDAGGAAVGVLLPLIEDRYFQVFTGRNGAYRREPREVEKLFGDPNDMAAVGLAPIDWRQRIAIARRIAEVYADLHADNVVAGDISGRNVVYDAGGNNPQVLVVDADACRLQRSRGAFGSQPQTPFWEPPEALLAARRLRAATRSAGTVRPDVVERLRRQTMVQNTATDVYKVALMLVRVMDPGRRHSVSRNPKRALDLFRRVWGVQAATALERALSDLPDDRPSATELRLAMQRPDNPPTVPRPRTPAGVPAGTRVGRWTYQPGVGWVR